MLNSFISSRSHNCWAHGISNFHYSQTINLSAILCDTSSDNPELGNGRVNIRFQELNCNQTHALAVGSN